MKFDGGAVFYCQSINLNHDKMLHQRKKLSTIFFGFQHLQLTKYDSCVFQVIPASAGPLPWDCLHPWCQFWEQQQREDWLPPGEGAHWHSRGWGTTGYIVREYWQERIGCIVRDYWLQRIGYIFREYWLDRIGFIVREYRLNRIGYIVRKYWQ